MKKLLLVSILTVCLVGSVQASMFKSNDRVKHISYFSLRAQINAYVMDIHSSSVRSSNAKIKDHLGWLRGKGRYKQYLRTQLADGDGMVVHTRYGHDSAVRGHDASHGSIGYPVDLDRSVSFLPMSDDCREAVAIDNLDVISTPAPGAVLLGIFGLSVVGVKLRKYA